MLRAGPNKGRQTVVVQHVYRGGQAVGAVAKDAAGDAPMRPFKRPHRWTGRPKGPPPGSQNRLTHGLKTAASKARRRAVNALPRAARAAIREAT
jgi:hypothetical protein